MKTIIKYRIFHIDENGLIERPKEGWMKDCEKYEDGETIEECRAQIEKKQDWAEYVIMPVTCEQVE